MKLLPVVLALLLCSCAKPPVWVPDAGKDVADWKKDSYECDRDAEMMKAGFRHREMFGRCMEARGWTRKREQ